MRNTIRIFFFVLAAVILAGAGPVTAGDGVEFDFDGATPVGSWQEREQVQTDAKGKQTVTVMKMSFLGEEERGGEPFIWIENEITTFKVKKSGRKPTGEPVVMKALMKKSLFEGDVINSLSNLNNFAAEIIVQSGDNPPMRISGAGSMGGMMQAMGIAIEYDITPDGTESVTVPAGTFDCRRYKGHGTTTAKIVFKTMTVESRSTQWISDDVPFGVVKIVSDDDVNGKTTHTETVLTAFGKSGAKSKITGEPMDMPSMGNLFGGG